MFCDIHSIFGKGHKNSLCFTREISHKLCSLYTHTPEELSGGQSNHRATEEENGWNPPFIVSHPFQMRSVGKKSRCSSQGNMIRVMASNEGRVWQEDIWYLAEGGGWGRGGMINDPYHVTLWAAPALLSHTSQLGTFEFFFLLVFLLSV